jgi:PilZ domain
MDSPNAQPATAALTERDRRFHRRYTVQVQIELHQEGNDVPMRLATTDLSRGGCYVELMMPFSIGTHVQATLWLNVHRIVIQGRVVTCHPQYGNGIMFEKFEGQAERLLHEYLDSIVTTT